MEFKFSIGDYVMLEAHVALFGLARVQPLRVAERWSQECEGGVQRTYLVRAIEPEGGVWGSRTASFGTQHYEGLARIKESELTALDVTAYREARAPKKQSE